MNHEQVVRLSLVLAIFILPAYVVRFGLWAAQRWWNADLRGAVPWLKALRFVAWTIGMLIIVTHWFYEVIPWYYGVACVTASIGLAAPETWVKKRVAPDLMLDVSREGWWPSKSE